MSRLALSATFGLDVAFVALSIAFFAVSIGYVAVCDRLMKRGDR